MKDVHKRLITPNYDEDHQQTLMKFSLPTNSINFQRLAERTGSVERKESTNREEAVDRIFDHKILTKNECRTNVKN